MRKGRLIMEFAEFNSKIGKEHSRQYARNSAENYQRIKAEFQKADYSIDTLPRYKPEARVPAIILGSGPTLDDVLPYVGRFKGVVFASPSQLDILEKWEITPDFVVAVDSADNVGEEQIRGDRDCYGMTLITHPYISPKTLEAWHGAKRYFELQEADGEHFRDVYPWIKVPFPVCGSVNNMQVLIARWMGCAPIILAGVDYCYPEGRTRAQDWRKRGPYIFDPKPLQYCETKPGLTTDSQEVAFYSNLLLGIWKMYKLPLIQVGDKSHYPEIPFIQPEDILKIIEIGGPSEEHIKQVDETLFEYGMTATVDENGIGHFHFRESDLKDFEMAKKLLIQTAEQAEVWGKL
jgi:hypothetical protein